jgi:hypothetical protein
MVLNIIKMGFGARIARQNQLSPVRLSIAKESFAVLNPWMFASFQNRDIASLER